MFLSHVKNGGSRFLKKFLESKSSHVTAEAKAKAEEIVASQIVPSFGAFAEYLSNTYIPALTTEVACTVRHPGGADFYQVRRCCKELHKSTANVPFM